jgi:hypothetical protein
VLSLLAQASPSAGCATTHCFLVLKAADEFTKLTGSLAAFTFTSLIFLVGRAADRRKLEDTTIMFVTAFLALVIASFLYERLSADELGSGRAEALYFSASIVFAFAVLELFLGLTRLLMRLGYGPASRFMRGASVGFLPPLVYIFLMITAVDSYGFRMTETHAWFHTAVAYVALVGAVALAGVVVWRMWRTFHPRTRLPAHDTRLVRCAVASLVIIGALTAGAAAVSELGAGTNFPEWLYLVGLGVATITIAAYACLASAGGLPEDVDG